MDELTLLLREVARSVFELALLTVYVHNSIVLILLMHDFKCRSCMLPLLFSGALIAIESDFLNSKWLCSMPSVSVAIRSCDLFQGPYLFATNCMINLVGWPTFQSQVRAHSKNPICWITFICYSESITYFSSCTFWKPLVKWD